MWFSTMTDTGFLAEEQLLLALAKPNPQELDVFQGEAVLSRQDFKWSMALDLARSHWVLPMLGWNLKAHESIWKRVPKPVRTELGVGNLLARQRRSMYLDGLAPVFEDLGYQKIPFALMKGAVVMETVYPRDSRLLNDLDLLIPLEWRARAIDIFRQHGFRLIAEVPDPTVRHQVSLVKKQGVIGLAVDLHWDVYPKGRLFYFDVHEVLARTRMQIFGKIQVPGMSPEDTFVHYATQLVNDRFRHAFVRFGDLYGLVSSGLQPQQLNLIASSTGASGITYTALKVVNLLGHRMTDDLVTVLLKSCPGSEIATEFLLQPQWMFGRGRLSKGIGAFLVPLYLSDSHARRKYWSTFSQKVYRRERKAGRSTIVAYYLAIRAMASMLMGGCLVLLSVFSPAPVKKILRNQIWRTGI
jgi:hypothetical protein